MIYRSSKNNQICPILVSEPIKDLDGKCLVFGGKYKNPFSDSHRTVKPDRFLPNPSKMNIKLNKQIKIGDKLIIKTFNKKSEAYDKTMNVTTNEINDNTKQLVFTFKKSNSNLIHYLFVDWQRFNDLLKQNRIEFKN